MTYQNDAVLKLIYIKAKYRLIFHVSSYENVAEYSPKYICIKDQMGLKLSDIFLIYKLIQTTLYTENFHSIQQVYN